MDKVCRCGHELREESRNWGTVVVCPGCDFAKPGHISAWAKANSALGAAESAHRAEVYGQKSDTLADAIQAAGGVSASAAVRREYDPDADAAAEEADVASW